MIKEPQEFDVFISHASEDKLTLVEDLAEHLEKAGLRVWYDNIRLKAGDSLSSSIDEGLVKSRFGIVILSSFFFEKNWPKHELAGLRMREMDGKSRIIPIWHGVSLSDVGKFSPTLADMLSIDAGSMPVSDVSEEILDIVEPQRNSKWLYQRAVETAEGIEEIEYDGPEFDYWPDSGFRVIYRRIAKFISPSQLQDRFGGPIWLSGPHSRFAIDMNNSSDFGRYNPAFVDWLYDNIVTIVGKPGFLKLSRPVYVRAFQNATMVYWASYEFIRRNPDVMELLKWALLPDADSGGLPRYRYSDFSWAREEGREKIFRMVARLRRINQISISTVFSAVSFWVRRSSDGTADQFMRICSFILETYSSAELHAVVEHSNWNLLIPDEKDDLDVQDFREFMARVLVELREKQGE